MSDNHYPELGPATNREYLKVIGRDSSNLPAKSASNFGIIVLRLKTQLQVETDKHIAATLGMKPSAFGLAEKLTLLMMTAAEAPLEPDTQEVAA